MLSCSWVLLSEVVSLALLFMKRPYAVDAERVHSYGVDVTRDDLEKLAQMPNFKESTLADRAISYLLHFPDLQTLNLKSLDISDHALRDLASLHKLEQIVFSHPWLTPAALERLQRELPDCEIVVDGRVFQL